MRLVVVFIVISLCRPTLASPQRDIDGDGFDDATIEGLLYFGSAKGVVAGPAPKLPRNVTMFALDVVGDVNGDGHADVILGDPGCPPITRVMPVCATGSAYLFLGGPKRLAAKPTQTLTMPGQNSLFGMNIIPLGDVNGDRLADVAIPDSAAVHIYLGTKTGLATKPIDLPVQQIQPIGDVDHDGRADLIAISHRTATIYYGADPKRTTVIPIDGDSEFYGTAGSGDFDGDGYGDLAISVEPKSPTGDLVANDIVIYRGGAKGLVLKPAARFTRDHPRAELGAMFASVGDLDGDHHDDLVILAGCAIYDAKQSSCDGAAAYVYLGSPKGLAPRPAVELTPKRSNFTISGGTVGALGDIDGDHHPDFTFSGYVFRGGKGGVIDLHPPSL